MPIRGGANTLHASSVSSSSSASSASSTSSALSSAVPADADTGTPAPAEFFVHRRVVRVAASGWIALAATADGRVWQWSQRGVHGRVVRPHALQGLPGIVPARLVAGHTEMFALVPDGDSQSAAAAAAARRSEEPDAAEQRSQAAQLEAEAEAVVAAEELTSVSMQRGSETGGARTRSDLEAVLRRVAPDIAGQLPAAFLPTFKSPCWRVAAGDDGDDGSSAMHPAGRLRCVPYFYVVGGSDCGAERLYALLSAHEAVQPAGTLADAFWTTRRPWSWFLNVLDPATTRVSQRATVATIGSAAVDALAHAATGVRGVPLSAHAAAASSPPPGLADALAAVWPSQRLVVVLREPGERLLAAFVRLGCSSSERGGARVPPEWDAAAPARAFHLYAERLVEAFESCLSSTSSTSSAQRRAPPAVTCAHRSPWQRDELALGLYAQLLQPWLTAFDRQQVSLVLSHCPQQPHFQSGSPQLASAYPSPRLPRR
jgi:hypothetical protein